MAKYRSDLPQMSGELFLTDSGMETTLIFHKGLELPGFASFTLLESETAVETMRRYYARHAAIARANGFGFILESPTWRASADWAAKLGYSADDIAAANRHSLQLMHDLRARHETAASPMVVSGCVGPRGDGYNPTNVMSADEAQAYHREQIAIFSDTAADMVSAITMNYAEEAIGVARAAQEAGMPVAISFTVETDGRLPTGQPLPDAMQQVDEATGAYPAYYMLNCAHPEHFEKVLEQPWARRIRGLRANASRKSHAELNESTELDIGNPAELGVHYAALKRASLPNLNVVGGCCGTDHRHVQRIAAACAPLFRVAA